MTQAVAGNSTNAPILRFGQRPGSRGYPNAEIMASMAGAFLHGPVEAF